MDSRLTRPVGIVVTGRFAGSVVYSEPVFCVGCGHQGGTVTFGMPRRDGPVIFLCGAENGCGCDCESKYGVPEAMFTKVPNPEGWETV